MQNILNTIRPKIIFITAIIITNLSIKSCEFPEYENGPSSKIQHFAWLYGGGWNAIGEAIIETDTAVDTCNSVPFNIFTTYTDVKISMEIDTLNWSRDSSFTIKWSDLFTVKIRAPDRPSSCGGPLSKDTFIETNWKTKIDSIQFSNYDDMVYITQVPNSPFSIRLEPIWIMYDKELNNMKVTLLSATNEPILTRELYRSWHLLLKF